ncbi:MAG: DinB family protein, partial [Acidobacteriota bacterium]
LAAQNLHFLDQATDLLEAVDDSRYTSKDSHGHSSIGSHLRHVLDAYRCFLSGLEDGRVDYDARQREPAIEVSRSAALARIREVRGHLAELNERDRPRLLKVRADAAAWGEVDAWTDSTLGRELHFLLSHTVHHFALIAMTLRGLDFEPGKGFGVAPSTLEHRGAEAAEKPGVEAREAAPCAR